LPAIFINKAVNSCHVCPNSLLLLSLAITAAPLINAIVTLSFIRPYRAAFLSWVGIDNYGKIYLRTCPLQQQLERFERQYNASLSTNISEGPV
jgi:hypothetical protein